FDPRYTAAFQQHLHAMVERVAAETSPESMRTIQASFRGELRDYREKARLHLQRLHDDLEGAAEAMNTFAGNIVANGADTEQRVRGELQNLEKVANGDDIAQIRQAVHTVAEEIYESYDELNKLNSLVVAQLQNEIRLLHREMEAERRAAMSDPESGAWLRRK